MIKRYIFIILLSSFTTSSMASELECGPVANRDGIGPWDYNDPINHRPSSDAMQGRVYNVEHHHFTKQVERLQKGVTGTIVGDIAFTLKRFPNHPRALLAISRYKRKGGNLSADESGRPRTIDCFFDRAIRFTPSDATVHMLYGMHLHLSNKMPDAEREYLIAEALAPNNIDLKYNIGLYYFDLKNYEKSLSYAKTAYENNYPLPGLMNKLKSIDKWPKI